MNSAYGAGIHACAAIDAGICIDNTFSTLLADGIHRTGIFTSPTVCTIIIN